VANLIEATMTGKDFQRIAGQFTNTGFADFNPPIAEDLFKALVRSESSKEANEKFAAQFSYRLHVVKGILNLMAEQIGASCFR
jgi:hypothetical protein